MPPLLINRSNKPNYWLIFSLKKIHCFYKFFLCLEIIEIENVYVIFFGISFNTVKNYYVCLKKGILGFKEIYY